MDRDFRLTGEWRGQSDNVAAPTGFEVNNPWRVCKLLLNVSTTTKLCPDGGKDYLIQKPSNCAVHIILPLGHTILYLQDRACFATYLVFCGSNNGVVVCARSRALQRLLDF